MAPLTQRPEQLGSGDDEAGTGDDDECRGTDGRGHEYDDADGDARDDGDADVASGTFAHARGLVVEGARRVTADADRYGSVLGLSDRRLAQEDRSEERRVGKGCRTRGSPR